MHLSGWSPYLVKDIDVLEKVQKRAMKLIKGYEKLPWGFRLFCRRQWGDLIEVLKILNGYYDINPLQFFTSSDATEISNVDISNILENINMI